MDKVRVHDGVVGSVVTVGTVLGYYVDSTWLLIPAIIGVVLIQSAFTGFCPVYCTLDKIQPDDDKKES